MPRKPLKVWRRAESAAPLWPAEPARRSFATGSDIPLEPWAILGPSGLVRATGLGCVRAVRRAVGNEADQVHRLADLECGGRRLSG